MSQTDKRGYLDTEPFSYRIAKNGKVFLSWEGKQVSILQGKAAEKFIRDIERLSSKDQQLRMAKLTGNFKRGNERKP